MMTNQQNSTATSTRKRDPQARQQAIVRAAAELIIEDGRQLTHRRVAEKANVPLGSTTYYFNTLEELHDAALLLLVGTVDADLTDFSHQAASCAGDPEMLAALLCDYFTQQDRVRTDMALYTAAVERPELRPLSIRWFNGMVELFSAWTDAQTAHMAAIFIDGLGIYAALHDEPPEKTQLAAMLKTLLSGQKDSTTQKMKA